MRRLLFLSCAIVLVDTAFYAVVAPLLPGLEDELGLSKTEAGILVAAYPAGTLVAAVPSGVLATRLGPRRLVVAGLVLLGISSLVFGLVREPLALDLARFVQGVGGACSWAGAMAWLIEAAPPAERGRYIGIALGAAIGGALLGPVLGGVADAAGQGITFGGVAVVAALVTVAVLREPAPPEPRRQRLADVTAALRRPDLQLALWLVALPSLAFGTINTLVPLRLDELGAGSGAVAAAFLVAAAIEALLSPRIGRLADTRGAEVPIRAGLLAAAVALAVVVVPDAAVAVGVLLVLADLAIALFFVPAMALLSARGDAAGLGQGPSFGLINLGWAGGVSVGALLAGAVADVTADVVPFAVTGALCLATYAALARRPAPVAA